MIQNLNKIWTNKNNFEYFFKQKVRVFYNEKVFILTTFKIGSKWCDYAINQDDKTRQSLGQIYKPSLELLPSKQSENNLHFKNIQKIWNLFLKRKENRDLVIFYRNPIEQFLSAFIEDYIASFDISSVNEHYFNLFLKSLNLDKNYIEKFFNDFRTNNYIIDENLWENYGDICEEIVLFSLKPYLKGYLDGAHYSQWISFIFQLLNENLIDIDKIKLVDIYDDDLNNQLKKYLTNIDTNNLQKKLTYSNMHNKILSCIEKNQKYRSVIFSYLKNEIYLYSQIKRLYKNQHLFIKHT